MRESIRLEEIRQNIRNFSCARFKGKNRLYELISITFRKAQPSYDKGPTRSRCSARISEHRRRRSFDSMHVSTSLNHELETFILVEI